MYYDSNTWDNGKRAIGKGKVGNRATIDRLLRYGLSLKVTFNKRPKVCVRAGHVKICGSMRQALSRYSEQQGQRPSWRTVLVYLKNRQARVG